MGLALGHSRCKQPVATQSIIKNAFGPSGIPDGLFLASKETSMIEIAQVNASLDEAGDENACLIVGYINSFNKSRGEYYGKRFKKKSKNS